MPEHAADRPTLLSIGHGYSARALAARLMAKGWRVIGTARRDEALAGIAATGAEARLWPGTDPEALLGGATHLLSSVPPSREPPADPVVDALGPAIAGHGWAWAGYLSTTGVYGDRGGAAVDETTPVAPSTQRGRARAVAEAAWQGLRETGAVPVHVFRLAGIYGPGRSAFDRLRDGTARRIVKEGQVFARIHVEDLAAVVEASIARPRPGAVYNIADDEPAPPEDVIEHAARLLGLPVPPAIPFEEAELSPMAASFYAESKRVSNRLIREELGVRLAHPTYREGLAAILAAERASGVGE